MNRYDEADWLVSFFWMLCCGFGHEATDNASLGLNQVFPEVGGGLTGESLVGRDKLS
ncbi:hypothetical protein [Erythrobacter sp. R86502]|uniref:hypothetical protein n=1 Tax=Erythrobacter sp. R86502 TaxID=3093846 RepID=UPI0036D3E331